MARFCFVLILLGISLLAGCRAVEVEPPVAATLVPAPPTGTATAIAPTATLRPSSTPTRVIVAAAPPALQPVVSGVSATALPARSTIRGAWRTQGQGLLLEFRGDRVEWYEVTAASCLPAGSNEWDGEGFQQGTERIIPLLEKNRLMLPLASGTVYAEPLAALPERCSGNSAPVSADPEFNFELFWHTFNENYSLFEQYNVDWQEVYDLYRPQITAESTPAELFDVLTEMLAPMKDSHIRLVTNNRQFTTWELPTWMRRPPNFREVATEQYLDEGWQSGGQERLLWGTIDKRIGYLSLHQLQGFTLNGENDEEYLREALEQIMGRFQNMQALVVDLRLSNEGRPEHALTIASHLAASRTLAYSVQTRDGLRFTDLEDFYIEPAGPQRFSGPIYVLTSRMTGGASELLVLGLSVLPRSTVIGEPTAGSQSGVLERRLPNGWTVELSNQLTYGPAGVVYESIGFPPDISMPIVPAAYEEADPMLEEVIRRVMER